MFLECLNVHYHVPLMYISYMYICTLNVHVVYIVHSMYIIMYIECTLGEPHMRPYCTNCTWLCTLNVQCIYFLMYIVMYIVLYVIMSHIPQIMYMECNVKWTLHSCVHSSKGAHQIVRCPSVATSCYQCSPRRAKSFGDTAWDFSVPVFGSCVLSYSAAYC